MEPVEKSFTVDDQNRFATLSGDRNPLHMDPIIARRSPFGATLVHGVHIVLWALDQFLCRVPQSPRPAGLKVDFTQPCTVGAIVTLHLLDQQFGTIKLEVRAGQTVLVKIVLLTTVPSFTSPAADIRPTLVSRNISEPLNLVLADLEHQTGRFRFAGSGLGDAFPHASAQLGEPVVAGLAGLSTVVGMLCPGLYSIFSAFSAKFTSDIGECASYAVDRVHDSVRQVSLRIRVRGVDASVRAGARPRPVEQLSFSTVKDLVAPNVFAGRRPLIIGGSRGLGEVTAKLVAAGGGEPTITYATGRSDAERVAQEINSGGGRCHIIPYDFKLNAASQLPTSNGPISTVYYFATTPIMRPRYKNFQSNLLQDFIQAYVTSFSEIIEEIFKREYHTLSAFYPSSIFLEPDSHLTEFVEYAVAKAAGEMLCAHLVVQYPQLRLKIARLPRAATDQTATIIPVGAQNPLEIMLPIVHDLEAESARYVD